MSKLDDVMQRMVGFDDIDPDFKGMIYGETGTGKTKFLMELAQAISPEGTGIIYADSLDGWVTLKNHPDLKARTKRYPVGSLEELAELGEMLRDREGMFEYVTTLVIDESSSIYQYDLNAVLRASLGTPEGDIPSRPPEWPEYFKAQNRYKALFDMIYNVPGLNVIHGAHVRYDKEKPGDTPVVTADFSPGIAKDLRKPLHLLGHMTAKLTSGTASQDAPEYKRVIQVHPSTFVVAKTRIGGLPVKLSPEELIAEVVDWMGDEERRTVDLTTEVGSTVVEEHEVASDSDDAPAYTEG